MAVAASSSAFAQMATNSSPPIRPTTSSERTPALSLTANSTRTMSPTAWPNRSLIDLNSSTSRNSTASGSSRTDAASSASARLCSRSCRLATPVSWSCSARKASWRCNLTRTSVCDAWRPSAFCNAKNWSSNCRARPKKQTRIPSRRRSSSRGITLTAASRVARSAAASSGNSPAAPSSSTTTTSGLLRRLTIGRTSPARGLVPPTRVSSPSSSSSSTPASRAANAVRATSAKECATSSSLALTPKVRDTSCKTLTCASDDSAARRACRRSRSYSMRPDALNTAIRIIPAAASRIELIRTCSGMPSAPSIVSATSLSRPCKGRACACLVS